MKPLDRNRPTVTLAANAIRSAAVAYFETLRTRVTAQLQAELGKADKDTEARVQRILDDMDFEGYEAFADVVRQELLTLYEDGAQAAMSQVGAVGVSVDQVNTQAAEYAADRSAEMVGMKRVNGELVPNPKAEWQITDGTREMLRRLVTDAIEEGHSNEFLADALADIYAFSDERAEVIARTETARADVEGNLAGYRASGLVAAKQWLTAPDCCDLCQELDGEQVGLDEQFPDGGGSGPPLHPQCRCDVLPVLSSEDKEQDE